ncbi:MAG TPA: ion transporter [Pyrinomonadaceae bacterium]|nr:ion transporter [Pyrinomonadaceae bacterium]
MSRQPTQDESGKRAAEASPPAGGWRGRLHEIIFEADTPGGRAFDVTLIVLILLSVLAVMLESVGEMRERFGAELYVAEWAFTLLFTVEYLLRLLSVRRPARYAFSFYGVVDLLAIVPTYLSLLLPGSHYLLVVRILRLLRVFRVLKLAAHLSEADVLLRALRASRRKISVFLLTVMTLVVIIGTLLYVVEGEENGFTSIPTSIYWAVVTLTTVGYGDISPKTPLGQAFAVLVMITGYGIIAVPTGIVTVELAQAARGAVSTQSCPECGSEGHDADAVHCKYCAARL